jgi:hypothetical protein
MRGWLSSGTRITDVVPKIAPSLTIGESHFMPIASTPTRVRHFEADFELKWALCTL